MQLNTARGTVEMAYNILVDEGYLQMRGAAGTFVSPSLPPSVTLAASAQKARARACRSATRFAVIAQQRSRDIDATLLRPGLPALDAFPRKVWSRLVAYRARSGDVASLTYPDPAGYRPLREHIATYLGLSRGVDCEPEQVFVTNGYRAALELVLRSLAKPDDSAWYEEPGYLLARNFLVEAGLRLVPVPIDQEGIDVAARRDARTERALCFRDAGASKPARCHVVVAATHHAARLGEARGSWIIEDDYDSEFRYAGRPLPALKSLDRDDRVIYCGTFSKVMFPGLRLSYIVASGARHRALRADHERHERRTAAPVAGGGGGFHCAGTFLRGI